MIGLLDRLLWDLIFVGRWWGHLSLHAPLRSARLHLALPSHALICSLLSRSQLSVFHSQLHAFFLYSNLHARSLPHSFFFFSSARPLCYSPSTPLLSSPLRSTLRAWIVRANTKSLIEHRTTPHNRRQMFDVTTVLFPFFLCWLIWAILVCVPRKSCQD